MSLIRMSFYGAIMIIVTAAIRCLLLNKLPKITFVVLWEIVILRLIIPFSFSSSFSIYSIIKLITQKDTPSAMQLPFQTYKLLPLSDVPYDIPTQFPLQMSKIIWLLGTIFFLVIFIVNHLYYRRKYSMALPVNNKFIADWKLKHIIIRKIEIKYSDRITAPLTYGIVKPIILLPKILDLEKKSQLNYILAHELTHIKRFDILVKLFAVAAVSLHWFNPFVWVMLILLNRDIELSCDESVVRSVGENIKSDYALALISLEETKNVFALCNNFSKNATRERIIAIMKTKKITVAAILSAIVLIVVTSIVFATSVNDKTAVSQTQDIANMLDKTDESSNNESISLTPETNETNAIISSSEKDFELVIPVKNSFVGCDFDEYPGHPGIDYVATEGTDIVASADGEVVTTKFDNDFGYGNYIIIDHGNGFSTRYAHCNELKVEVGDVVKKDDVIATVGLTGRATGPHCHFELLIDGKYTNPNDYLE